MQNPLVTPVVPVDSTVQFWVRNNKCKIKKSVLYVEDANVYDSSTVEVHQYNSCKCNAGVKFYKINNGGHTWQGVYVASQAAVLGHTNLDINGSEELWRFLKDYQLCTADSTTNYRAGLLPPEPIPSPEPIPLPGQIL